MDKITSLITERLKLKDVFPDRAKEIAKATGKKEGDIEFIRKFFVGEIKDINKEERTSVDLISAKTVDRDLEVLLPDKVRLGNFRKNPVVLWAHNYGELPIGKALWIKANKEGVLSKTRYAKHQFAEDVWNCKRDGFLKASSVGFIPLNYTDDVKEIEAIRKQYDIKATPKRVFTDWEMLEYSHVPVPSNPDALELMVKSVRSEKMKEVIKSIKKEVKDQKPEETDDTIRISIEGEEGKHDDHKIKLIAISKKQGIEACYCEDCKKVIAYKFDKDNDLGMEDAKEWIKDHGKNIAGIIDNGIKKTIDNMSDEDWKALGESIEKYLETGEVEKTVYKCSCIDCGWETESEKHCKDIKCEKCGGTMRRSERPGPGQETDDAKDDSKNLVTISDSLLEFEEGKIDRKEMLEKIEKAMTDVIDKVGAVLSKKNKSKLMTAKENIQHVLDVAEIASGDDEKAISNEDIIEAIKDIRKSLKTKEVKKETPPKQEDKEKEVSDVDVQDIKTAIRDSVGKYMDKRIREIKLTVLGKV